jgi:hypothetical protein
MHCRTQIRNEVYDELSNHAVTGFKLRKSPMTPNEQTSPRTFVVFTGNEDIKKDTMMSGDEHGIVRTLTLTVECYAVGDEAVDEADEMAITAVQSITTALRNLPIVEFSQQSEDTAVTESGAQPAAVAMVVFTVIYRTTNTDPENFN